MIGPYSSTVSFHFLLSIQLLTRFKYLSGSVESGVLSWKRNNDHALVGFWEEPDVGFERRSQYFVRTGTHEFRYGNPSRGRHLRVSGRTCELSAGERASCGPLRATETGSVITFRRVVRGTKPTTLLVLTTLRVFNDASSRVHLRSSLECLPARVIPRAFAPTLTTTALYRSSLEWLEICS